VALCALLALPGGSAGAQEEWIAVTTAHFRVEAANVHTAQASWYAAFVEQVHDELSDLLGVSLDRSILVRLYPTEEAYVAANPAAASARGILAHAHPTGDEIGLALVRLEALPGSARVAAFRHELAHMLLDIRSGRRLPVSFQEGIAQYVEQDPRTDNDTLEGLRRAYAADRLLTWAELNRPASFIQRPNVSYPQSHALLAYLIEQHGVGSIGRLLDALRSDQDFDTAVQTAFGSNGDTLDRDWRGSIPSVLTNGLPRNVLADGNLRPAQQAAAEQRWEDAAALARVAEQFWANIGATEHRAEARELADLADSVVVFRKADDESQQRVAEQRYEEAIHIASSAMNLLPRSADPAYRARLEATVHQAQAGLQGQLSLDSARIHLSSYNIIEAQRAASLAEQQLAVAGDAVGSAEARDLRTYAQNIQHGVATTALIVALLSGGALWLHRHRPAPPVAIGTRNREVQL